jgi:hypothetical protein
LILSEAAQTECREKFVLQREEEKEKSRLCLFSLFWFMLFWSAGKDLNRCSGKTQTGKAGLVGQKIKLSLSPPLAGSPLSTFGRPSFASLESVADGAKKKKNCDGGVDKGTDGGVDKGTDRGVDKGTDRGVDTAIRF